MDHRLTDRLTTGWVDDRLTTGWVDHWWEPRPARKSVGAQITWGVRFETNEEADRFMTDLSKEVSYPLILSSGNFV
eukprot:2169071-Pyramimonas_sp.AAC.2